LIRNAENIFRAYIKENALASEPQREPMFRESVYMEPVFEPVFSESM
jgi:hypothetical protein